MATLWAFLAGLAVWVGGYHVLGRLFFPGRRKKWEVMEDMANEGAQTSCVLLVSGVAAIAVGILVAATLSRR